ncbi:hypothetical protein MANES_11G047175v8 [Manihot esculenta]|uniref:Uncharacterized protein n=1 Tax=Manihot esculenta TaxID=3983 RepID=A0A2C9UZP9_MANES|nr:hypothetical protein MANES_11G047175v8 [Manihot esculenta]
MQARILAFQDLEGQYVCFVVSIPFSAFWLRSSVVSVLISLISDTWAIGSHDIKLIFLWGEHVTVACYWGSWASPMRCTVAWAWRTPTNSSFKSFIVSLFLPHS